MDIEIKNNFLLQLFVYLYVFDMFKVAIKMQRNEL